MRVSISASFVCLASSLGAQTPPPDSADEALRAIVAAAPAWHSKQPAKQPAKQPNLASTGNHGRDVMTSGDLLVGAGPNRVSQRYQRPP